MAKSIVRTPRVRQFAVLAASSTALMLPATAWADCTSGTDSSGNPTVTCSGSSASYSTTTANTTATVNAGATVTGPLIVTGDSSTLTVNAASGSTAAGTITETAAKYAVQMGDNATVTNNGIITSTSTSSGAGAISVGASSTVTNNGELEAESGTAAVTFGTNGTYIQGTGTTAATTGNIVFNTNTGTDIATFSNTDVTYGVTGNVTASGNLKFTNAGIFTGDIIQTAVDGTETVTIDNKAATDSSGDAVGFTGIIQTGNNTTVTNEGLMYLYSSSVIGSYYASGTSGTSSFTNSGTLYVGTTSAAAQLPIYGSFTQTDTGVLNIAILGAGSSSVSAGTTYSQVYTTGSASLAGTLNINTGGYLADNTVYKVIDSVGGISGSFSNVTFNGNATSYFLKFTDLGIVTVDSSTGEQAYEVSASHTGYANEMRTLQGTASNGITNNQISVASGLDSLLNTANGDTASDEATFLGEVDSLANVSDIKLFLDQVSPEGYLAYATALRDQANAFQRTVEQRMNDQNSNHPEDGWWFNTQMQFDFSSTASTQGGYRTRDKMFGFTAGYDLSGPHHVIGIFAGINFDSLHYAPNSLSGHNRDIAFGVYGSQKFGDHLRVFGQIDYNVGHLSATKTITIGADVRTAYARASEGLFKANANVGYGFAVGTYKLEPYAGIDYNGGRVNSFTETNAGAADLTVGPMSATHTDVVAGASLERNKGVFRPYVKLAYRRQLTGDRNIVSAYFDGNSTDTFSVTGLPVGRSQFEPSAGVNWVFDDAGALFVGYQGSMRSNYNSQGINFGIRLEF